MRKILSSIILFIIYTPLFSQARGTVVSENGNVLVAATIYNLNSGKRTITNSKGYFELNAALNDSIAISSLGYESVYKPANKLLKENTIYLKEKVTNLRDVEVLSENAYTLVANIVAKNNQYIPASCSYEAYVKTTVSLDDEMQYFSDALMSYKITDKKTKAYINASRCIRKPDTAMEKIFARGTISEHLKQPFDCFANFKYSAFTCNKEELKKRYTVNVSKGTDSLLIINFIPKADNSKLKDKVIWYVNRNDSLIREIHFDLLPAYIGSHAATNLAAKQYWKNSKEIIRYKLYQNSLILESIYTIHITDMHSGILTNFNNKEAQYDRIWLISSYKKSIKPFVLKQNAKEYSNNISLERFGAKNYTYDFWKDESIQQTQKEKDFLAK